jgi:hypothetical protein
MTSFARADICFGLTLMDASLTLARLSRKLLRSADARRSDRESSQRGWGTRICWEVSSTRWQARRDERHGRYTCI